jgi:hypothetical protein
MRRFSLVIAFLASPLLVQAQVHGGAAAGGGHAVISAPRASSFAVPRAPSAGGTVFRGTPGRPLGTPTSGRRTFSNRPASRNSLPPSLSAFGPSNSLPDFTGAVPGLGFDFVHFAAVHPGLDRHRFPSVRRGFFPFFDSGFLLPYAGSYFGGDSDDGPYAENQTQEPYDPGPESDVNTDRRSSPGYAAQPVSAYDVVVEPQKPSEQYVFVRRDGSVFFAVAYSWSADNLFYVTQEGQRRSVSRDTLDLNATQQFNEQRGLTFQSPEHS